MPESKAEILYLFRSNQFQRAINEWHVNNNSPDANITVAWTYTEFVAILSANPYDNKRPQLPSNFYLHLLKLPGSVLRCLPGALLAEAAGQVDGFLEHYAIDRPNPVLLYMEIIEGEAYWVAFHGPDRFFYSGRSLDDNSSAEL
ncbi:hypothetical protein BDP27DRAFT_1370674 [Rhodocollybia butyracea]|uniref:Uncharacterized protein n=1 Tax=Rhodocollybia butyracea TaxID=206335 RepID=A0A9P5TZI1_9AGAR|nr:hypothetical protein BDP27DRAFT_1370674 [Rhodocollybia butyracea]